jgi:hypothetical protein
MYERDSSSKLDSVWSDNRTVLGPGFLMLLVALVVGLLTALR